MLFLEGKHKHLVDLNALLEIERISWKNKQNSIRNDSRPKTKVQLTKIQTPQPRVGRFQKAQ